MSSTTKSFYYQNKLYPFNFEIFKTTSGFISKNETQLLSQPYINLVEEFFPIPKLESEDIDTFISFCQHEHYELKPTNLSALYCLSTYYDVCTLKDEINKFIPGHHHEIISEYFNNKGNKSELEEEIFSEYLTDFVEDGRLFEIPVHKLYRILARYYTKYRETKSNYKEQDEKIANFIFESIDRIGFESLVLFDQITFENCSIKFIHEKLQKYSFISNFDNSITTKFIQALSTMNFRLQENSEYMNKEITSLKQENLKQKEINKTLNDNLSALFFISKINLPTKNVTIQKVSELLIYLSKYEMWNNPPIFFPNEHDNLYEIFNKKRKNDTTKIGLCLSTVELLYMNGLFISEAFIEHVNQFTEILFELRYSSQFFDSLLVILPEVKKLINPKTKLTIELRIDENSTKSSKENLDKIDSVNIGSKVSVIGESSFRDFSSIKEISIPPSVTVIEASSFEGCTSLREIELPNTLTTLGDSAFCDCKSLTKIKIPRTIHKINKKAFYGCSTLTQVELGEETYYILESAFEGCTSLKQINIPNRLIEVGSRAFYGCSSLTQISLPRTVINVGQGAFNNCTSLTQIKIPTTISKTIQEMNLKSKVSTESVSSDAIVDYGYDLYHGKGVSIDKEGAVKYFKMASDEGSTVGMYNYAYLLQYGDGLPVNKEEAVKYYKMGIDKGNNEAMNNYALMLQYGDRIPINKEEAIKYYKLAIRKGNSCSMCNYAYMLQYGDGIKIDKEEAIRYCKMAADKGNEHAMSNYGYMLYHGEGTPANKEAATKYYKEAADKENSNGIYNYASMLYEGGTVDKNQAASFIYFKKAADKGHSNSMNNCGFMLEHGIGVSTNKEESKKYYKLGIERGNVAALYNYSCMTQNESELQSEEERAKNFYTRGIDRDNYYELNNHHLLLKRDDEIDIEKATKYYSMFKEKIKTRSIQDLEQLIQNH